MAEEMKKQDYYGTERVTAWPESRAISSVTGHIVTKEGYVVQYEDGYKSWSPKEVFEAAYKPVYAMDFSGALVALREGKKVARPDWYESSHDYSWIVLENAGLYFKNNHGFSHAWFTDIRDILATDWQELTLPQE